ncbi:HAD family hydrolase [Dactylosporangium sp. CS-033363]|uniref:HAD family hydrolase n=1 Tax=Dactylosporangium sp. CS-033363 TaxID=3239935 RepID=UPI003D939905
MRYDAVLFDLDDTLTVTRTVKFAMHKAIARERHGRTLLDADIDEHYDLPLEQSLRALHGAPDTPAADLFALLDEYQPRFPHRAHPDAVTVVDTLLAAGLDVGVVTGSPASIARPVLSALGFPVARMLGVYCYNSAHLRKPDPAVFDEARARLRARHHPREPAVVYVGDALADYQAARAAGIDFVGVTTGTVDAGTFRAAGATRCVPGLTAALPALLPAERPR